MSRQRRSLLIGLAAFILSLVVFLFSLLQFGLSVGEAFAQSSVRPPANAAGSVRPPAPPPVDLPAQPGVPRPLDARPPLPPTPDVVVTPLGELGPNSASTLWNEARHGTPFSTSLPDKKAAILIQSEGVWWERLSKPGGVIAEAGANAIVVTILVLAIFYILRGRIEIEQGPSGVRIERFTGTERFGHWLVASSFVVLALTGLNLLYGREILIPLLGKDGFAALALAGKWLHNNVAWAFMVGLVMIFVMWVPANLPTAADLKWIAKLGGLFTRGVHPPAGKFNAGQKLVFWAVVLLGASVSLSGISLLFPFELPLFSKTFAVLNGLGFAAIWGAPLPTDLTPIQEMQLSEIWHAIVALAMIVIIIAHIYIGTIGMEGAFDAMASGMVDLNWAKEHHSLWVEKLEKEGKPGAGDAGGAAETPAE